MSTFSKRAQAEEIAGAIIEQRETNVTLAEVAQMRDADLYEWIESCGLAWDADERAWNACD